MKKGWTSLKGKKNLWIFFLIILLVGMGVGVYFGIKNGSQFHEILTNTFLSTPESFGSFLIQHFVVLCILFILSFFFIGIPMALIYLFYEGLTIGFCFTIFILSFQLGGFFYVLLFFILTKLLFLLLYLFFFTKLLSISKSMISMIVYKTEQNMRFIQLTKSCFLLIFLVFFLDIFLSFLTQPVLNLFLFLLR